MPKKELKISQFEGGLSTNTDPRDIADNELSSLKGLDVDYGGIIRCAGRSTLSTYPGSSNTISPGYGLFSFSSSRDEDGDVSSTNYLAVTSGTSVKIYDSASNTWNAMSAAPFDLGASSAASRSVYSSFYEAEGNLRICDGNFNTLANEPKLLNFNNTKNYGHGTDSNYPTTLAQVTTGLNGQVDGDSTAQLDGWSANKSSIETGVTSSNLKMINAGDKTKGLVEGDSDTTDFVTAISGNRVTVASGGIDHGSLNGNDNYYNGITCSLFNTVTADTSVVYGVVYNYDATGDYFDIWTGPNGDVDAADAIAAAGDSTAANWSFQVGQSETYLWKSELEDDGRARNTIQDDWGVTLMFDEGGSGEGGWMTDTSTRYKFYHSTIFDHPPNMPGKYQESHPSIFTMYPTKQSAGETTHSPVNEMWFRDGANAVSTNDSDDGGATDDADSIGSPSEQVPVDFHLLLRIKGDNTTAGGATFNIGNNSYPAAAQNDNNTNQDAGKYNFLDGNQRVTGGRIYWASNEDGYQKLYLLMEYDMEKGARMIQGAETGISYGAYAPWHSWVYLVASNPVIKPSFKTEGEVTVTDPPRIETYDSLTLREPNSKLNAKWKTSVIADGRAYIGNIMRQLKGTFEGGGTWNQFTNELQPVYQDMIIFSPRGQYDTFPEENQLVNMSGDGDYIVKLESFNNRLIVLYSNKVEVYSLPEHTLEEEALNLGLDGNYQCQSCKTDFGIAWINSKGVYIFDGEKLQKISGKIENMWQGKDGYAAFWKSDADDIPAIGYDPNSSKIIISKTMQASVDDDDTALGSNSDDALIYSLKTGAWTERLDAFDDNSSNSLERTNFVNYEGNSIFYHDGSVAPFKWNDVPSASDSTADSVQFTTKDIDFGTTAKKNIYKVVLTYKCTGDTNIVVKYDTNGRTSFGYDFSDTTSTNYGSSTLDDTSGVWATAILKPDNKAESNGVYSFQLKFSNTGQVPADFEINDISIVHRTRHLA